MLFPSPLEFLAAFGIAFLGGVLMTAAFALYARRTDRPSAARGAQWRAAAA